MFRYDWSRFDAKLGLIFTVGVLLVLNLAERMDFAVLAAGISALLAWLTVVLVPGRPRGHHLLGLVAYLLVGMALTWLAGALWPHPWLRLAGMGLVTFVGYLFLLQGAHAFMAAWCLVYWYLLVPLFLGEQDLRAVVLGHIVGAGLVIGLNLLKPVWRRASTGALPETGPGGPSEEDRPSLRSVLHYSSIVSVSIVTGVAAGARWLTSDPTLIANATLNIISPSITQTWRNGLERVILGTLGVVTGFYLGWFFPDAWVGHVVTAVTAFLALGVIRVSFGLLIGVFFFMLSYPWGAMQSEAGHFIANEKILGELAGVLVAVAAMAVLTRLHRQH